MAQIMETVRAAVPAAARSLFQFELHSVGGLSERPALDCLAIWIGEPQDPFRIVELVAGVLICFPNN